MASGDYSKTQYNNGAPPAINKTNLNNIEDKVDELDTSMLAVEGSRVRLYDAAYPYAINEPTFYLGVPYKSLTAANTGNTPSTSPTHWEVTGGGSGSATNVGYNFENGQYETHIIGWTRYADAAGALPVDGTGQAGTPTTTFARNTTTPINGLGDGLLSKTSGASRQGEGVSYDFTIDRGQTTSPAQITFTYKTPVEYLDEYLGVFLYDKTNGALIRMSVENIPATYGSISQFLTTFIPSTSTEYRLIFHVITDTTTQWTFEVDNIQVGQKNVAVGAAIGNWVSYDPYININSNISNVKTARFRRVGSNAEIEIELSITATWTAPSTFTFDIPLGLTLSGDRGAIGVARAYNIGGGSNALWNGSVAASNSNHLTIEGGEAGGISPWGNLVPFTWNTSGALNIILSASVPIAQWTSNVNMASDFTEYASNSNSSGTTEPYTPANIVKGSEGALIPNYYSATLGSIDRFVTFNTYSSTDLVLLEIYNPSTKTWLNHLNMGFGYMYDAISHYSGIQLLQYGATTFKISFGNCGGTSWTSAYQFNTLYSAGWRWRVRKVSNGNMAEVPTLVHAEYTNPYNAFQTPTTAQTFRFTTKVEDTHSAYNTTTGEYTVPVGGVYRVAVNMGESAGAAGITSQAFMLVDGVKKLTGFYITQGQYTTHPYDKLLRASAGQKIRLQYMVGSAWSCNIDTAITYVQFTRIGS